MTRSHRHAKRTNEPLLLGRRVRVAGTAIVAAVALGGLWSVGTAGAASTEIGAHRALVAVGAAAVPPANVKDLGLAPAAGRLDLDVVLKPRDPAALTAFVTAVSTPGSALYRHYLAKGQFASVFGPTEATIDAVSAALRARGLRVGRVASDGLVLPVTGTTGEVDSALGASMHSFRLASGAVAEANAAAPRLPAAVASSVQAIVGLDNLAKYAPEMAPAGSARAAGSQAPHLVKGQPAACGNAVASDGWTAPEISQAYDLAPLYGVGDFGAGETVDLFELAAFEGSDVAAYQKCYGTDVRLSTIPVDGGATSSATSHGATEVEVDIEDLVGLAPKLAHVNVYEGPNNTTGNLAVLNRIAKDDNARVVSTSWGGCEQSSGLVSGEEPILKMIAAQGQSFYSASGDGGSEECSAGNLNVQDPSSQLYITGVGGTNLNGLENPPAVAPSEDAWSGSGGGISSLWRMPSWQLHSTPGVINSFSSRKPCGAPSGDYCREVPDVSANAGIGYATLTGATATWGHIGGTSLAAPTWAALTALIDDSSASCRRAAVGFVNPALYKLAASTPVDFNDITVGNNADGNAALGGKYPATKGYDLATGLGTPEAANLAQSLCGVSMWTPQATAPATTLTESPSLASSGGNLYATFTNSSTSDVYYETYNGVSWSGISTVEINGTPVQTDFPPAIAISQGNPYVAWTDATTGEVDVSSFLNSTWSPAVVVGAGLALSSAGPALGASGTSVFAAWKGHTSDNVFLSIDNGSGWSTQTQVPGASTLYRPAITLDTGLGAVVVAWTTSANTMRDEAYSIFGFGGIGTIPGGTNAGPALAMVGSKLFVAWKGHDTDAVFYSSQPANRIYGTWAAQKFVSLALTLGSPALGVTGPTLYAVWSGKSTGTARLWYSASDPPQ